MRLVSPVWRCRRHVARLVTRNHASTSSVAARDPAGHQQARSATVELLSSLSLAWESLHLGHTYATAGG